MLRSFHEKRKAEEGFTLIELMVVVLIIGILVAIALPTFLGARNRANDKAAQSGLRNAIAAAKTCFTDDDTYTGCTNVVLGSIETALTFTTAAAGSAGPSEVSMDVPSGTIWDAASWSKSGTCFYLEDDSQQGTFYGSGATASGAACTATDAAGVTGTSW